MGQLANPERWKRELPGEFGALQQWVAGEPCALKLLGPFVGGRGRENVVLAEWVDERGSRLVGLKFTQRADRLAALRLAYENVPSKFRKHIVRMDDHRLGASTWTMLVLEIVGGDLGSFRPLSACRRLDGLAEALEHVIYQVLDGMNPVRRTAQFTTGSFLASLIGDRLPRIREESASLREPSSDIPLALVDDDHILTSVQVGHGHGDLNGGNILLCVKSPLDPDLFVLIDPDHYRPDLPLAHEPMHVLVALALELLADTTAGGEARRDLINIIIDPGASVSSPSPAVPEFQPISAAIHEGADRYALERGFGHFWRAEKLLALVAVALIHVARDLPGDPDRADRNRRWCIDLARAAAERYRMVIGQDNSYAVAEGGSRETTGTPSSVDGSRAADATAGLRRQRMHSARSGLLRIGRRRIVRVFAVLAVAGAMSPALLPEPPSAKTNYEDFVGEYTNVGSADASPIPMAVDIIRTGDKIVGKSAYYSDKSCQKDIQGEFSQEEPGGGYHVMETRIRSAPGRDCSSDQTSVWRMLGDSIEIIYYTQRYAGKEVSRATLHRAH